MNPAASVCVFRIEIGSTWYIPEVWGTAVNPECKMLLLAEAFEVLGINRVAFVTDARNKRSLSSETLATLSLMTG